MSNNDCYHKATQRGQAVFTLVAQDTTAPAVVCDWIARNIQTAPPEKLHEALDIAIEMRDCPGHKFAD